MKLLSVVGTRPQFIKHAPLSHKLRASHQETVVHTGQHYDYNMDRIFFEELNIPAPDFHLCSGSGPHGLQTGIMLQRIEEVIIDTSPDMVLVYGDTNSTLAAALAAVKLHVRVAHIEAGLRSFDSTMPEEINRILTDHCSSLLFCPTQTAIDNLEREGLKTGVFLTGDVMVDATLYAQSHARNSAIIERLNLASGQYYLATVHRASNTDSRDNMQSIINAFRRIKVPIVMPLHPRTRKQLHNFELYDTLPENVKPIEPVSHIDFSKLLSNAGKVLTDSGGIQKEACILHVPCITLRDNTEWVETLSAGCNVLVGSDEEKIVEAAMSFQPDFTSSNIFGCGACDKIAEIIKHLD